MYFKVHARMKQEEDLRRDERKRDLWGAKDSRDESNPKGKEVSSGGFDLRLWTPPPQVLYLSIVIYNFEGLGPRCACSLV